MSRRVYRLINPSELSRGVSYFGTAKDKSDGFIHLSTKDQVKETFEKYFKDEETNLLVIDLEDVKTYARVEWEASKSRGGELFAHVYGSEGIRPSSIIDILDMNDFKEWVTSFPIA